MNLIEINCLILLFVIRVGALDGRHPKIEEKYFQILQKRLKERKAFYRQSKSASKIDIRKYK